MVTLSGSSASVFSMQALPVLVGLAEHAGDQVDVDLREAERRARTGTPAPISGERCARPLISRMRSSKFSTPRLRRVTPIWRIAASFVSVSVPGSHSNVISSAPLHDGVAEQARDQRLQLLRRQERRRAAAEVDEVERPAGDRRLLRVQLPLAREHVEVLARPPARSCRCRRGSSRSDSASGRTGCEGRGRAAPPGPAGDASAGSASRSTASCDQTENGG